MYAIKRRTGRVVASAAALATMWVLAPTTAYAADPGPPPRCNLFNAITKGTDPVVGEVRGLQGLVIPMVIALVVAALLVAVVPRLRKNVLNALLWVVVIAIGGTVIISGVAAVVTTNCA